MFLRTLVVSVSMTIAVLATGPVRAREDAAPFCSVPGHKGTDPAMLRSRIEQEMQHLDRDGNGEVRIEEFVEMVISIARMIDANPPEVRPGDGWDTSGGDRVARCFGNHGDAESTARDRSGL